MLRITRSIDRPFHIDRDIVMLGHIVKKQGHIKTIGTLGELAILTV